MWTDSYGQLISGHCGFVTIVANNFFILIKLIKSLISKLVEDWLKKFADFYSIPPPHLFLWKSTRHFWEYF